MTTVKRILAAVDLSPQSQQIVDQACNFAASSGAKLHVVYVESGRASPESENPDEERLHLERLSALVRPVDELTLETEKRVLHGVPHRAIVEYAEAQRIELIVMGTHGRTGFTRLTLGSVAERVIQNANCPVQVLKSPQNDARQLDEAVRLLSDTFNDELVGSAAETEQRIVNVLIQRMEVTESTSEQMLDHLLQRDWATIESVGDDQIRWHFVSDVEFVKAHHSFQPHQVESPATELIIRARKLRASDIHVDPAPRNESRVRMRIDGQLEEYCRLDRSVAEHTINQWKMMAGLDIAEPFKPKEGRLSFPSSATQLEDVSGRLTTAPVASGEAVALRLFSRDDVYIPIAMLGFSSSAQSAVDTMLSQAEGLVLVTGPTGSGKSTTVYSMLETISSSGNNIVSIEDPVEYAVPFVRQMEVNDRHGISMTAGLRTMLRMDPDVVFLGEIRDALAAEIAMRAASSGRYVFSTLHTRDVASVITALRDLGLPNRSLAANISGIVNQRLVRRLCTACKTEVEPSQVERQLFESRNISIPNHVFRRVGCTRCRGTGYFGRVGLFEAIAMDDELQAALAHGKSESQMRELLAKKGMVCLNVDGLSKVAEGLTDYDESKRVHWL